ncbi:MAG: sodium:proton antiporter [Clostridia bacterium]|nr:sodium:proton antiporter [Clostridia bacterium]
MLWQNIPILLILLPLGLSSLTAALKGDHSRRLLFAVCLACLGMSAFLLYEIVQSAQPFTVKMGEVGSPFGNELYVSQTEATALVAFDAILLLSLMGGRHNIRRDVTAGRMNLFYAVCSLLLAALNALTLTNDIFSGYVFLEITTIAAGALIFVRSHEGTLLAAMRYMIMNLLGSGLFLLGVSILYSLSGELLFPALIEKLRLVHIEDKYTGALFMGLTLITLGLGMKSALFPFHTWLPNAYSLSTPAASSILSSLVSKAYIFLYIKILCRAVGLEIFKRSGAADVLMAYAVMAIVMGSIDAIQQHNVRRMVSYSSVAQIGYIFLAVSLGTREALSAAVFQIFAHSAAKAMLFPAVDRLVHVSGDNENFRDLRGSGYRAPLAGLAFTVGAFSIVGIPLLGGFSAKLYIASAAYAAGGARPYIVLAAFAISTVLNIIYFLRTVVTIYRKSDRQPNQGHIARIFNFDAAIACFLLINLYLGVGAANVMKLISNGINLW